MHRTRSTPLKPSLASHLPWLGHLVPIALLTLLVACGSDGGGSGVDITPGLDTDGDGLTDADELTLYGTSPALADTDGDGFDDREEIVDLGFDPDRNPLRFNPRISDIPVAEIEVTSPPIISVTCTEGTERTRSFTTDRSTETSNTITNSTSESSTQTLEFGVTLGAEAGTENIGINYEVSASESNSTTVGWSEEQSRTNSTTFSASRTYAETENETCIGGEVLTSVRVTNTGDVAFTLRNLVLSASYPDRRDPWTPVPVGNLLFDTAGSGIGEFPATTLAPGQSISQLVFKNSALNLRTVEAILRESSNLVVEAVSREVTDANDQSFVHSATSIQATTATLLIDYGVFEEQERYHVSTNIRSDAFGVTAGEVLRDYLRLEAGNPGGYELGTAPWDFDGDNQVDGQTFQGLVSVRGIATDSSTNSYWVVAHTVDDGRGQTTTFHSPLETDFDLDSLELRAGDVLHLAYIQDVDGDGLAGRSEFLYGTDPDNPDTDGDGLTDGEEILGWDITVRGSQQRVHSNPLVVDTDGDGDDDSTERDNGTHPSQRSEPTVSEFALDGDDFTVTVSAIVEDADGVVEEITVDWGDNSNPYVESGSELAGITDVEHTYDEPGLYTVTITATDDDGNENFFPAERDVAIPIGMLAFYELDGNDLDSGPFGINGAFYNEGYAADRYESAETFAGVFYNAVFISLNGVTAISYPQLAAPHLDFSSSFTMAVWFLNHNPRAEGSRVMGQGNWFSLYLEDGNLAFGQLDERTPTGPRARNPDDHYASRWTFAVGVVSYDGEDSTIALYVDGEEVNRITAAGTEFVNPGECNFYVGPMYANAREDPFGVDSVDGRPDGGNPVPLDPGSECDAGYALVSFAGYIDDARVWDRALSAEEIRALYEAESEGCTRCDFFD